MHHGPICVLQSIVADANIRKAFVVVKARGLRSADATRSGDLVAMDIYFVDMHLIIDGVVTSSFRNSILSRVAAVPGFASKQAEKRKVDADRARAQPVIAIHGGRSALFPL